jgi:hypothetical protein
MADATVMSGYRIVAGCMSMYRHLLSCKLLGMLSAVVLRCDTYTVAAVIRRIAGREDCVHVLPVAVAYLANQRQLLA